MVYNHCIPSLHGEGEEGGRRREEDHSDTSTVCPVPMYLQHKYRESAYPWQRRAQCLSLQVCSAIMAPGPVSVLFIVQTHPLHQWTTEAPPDWCIRTHRPSLTLDIATLMCTKCLLAEPWSPVHWLCRETEFLALSSWVGLPACYTNWHVNTQYTWHPIPRSILYTQERQCNQLVEAQSDSVTDHNHNTIKTL